MEIATIIIKYIIKLMMVFSFWFFAVEIYGKKKGFLALLLIYSIIFLSGCASTPVYNCECTSPRAYYGTSCTCTPQKDRKNKSPLKTSGKASDDFWKIDDVEIKTITTDEVL